MVFTRFRRGKQFAIVLALAGLMSPGPAQAVEAGGGGRLASLAEAVAQLDETVTVAPQRHDSIFKTIAQGRASYYGNELAGNRTASGERFNPNALTAAHRSLPLGTKLRVTNLANGRSVIVRVNDRGPFVGNRLIDVSLAAAREIRMIGSGTAQVRLDIVRTA
jgi:rare lipoprotein A